MNDIPKNVRESLADSSPIADKSENENNQQTFEEDKSDEELEIQFSQVWPQVFKGCLANTLSLLTGINTGFSTVFISQLMADPNIKEFTKSEASWIASLSVLSGPIGAFCIGPIMDKIGRKRAIMIANVMPILCWALTYSVTDTIWPLYVARMIGGIGAAMMASVGVYVTEICHPKVRDVMLVMVGAFVSLGTLLTMILGSYIEWHRATLCFTFLAVSSLITSFFLPESPNWLVSFRPTQKRLNKALILTRYFNRSHKLYEKESQRIKEIYAKTKKSDEVPKKKNTLKNWLLKNFKLFQERGVYKPMFILLTIFFFWAFSGVFVVLMYSANVFKAIGSHFGRGFDEYTATIIIGTVKLVMTLLSAFISFRLGRKTLLITSSIGMTIFILTAGILQSFSNTQLDFSRRTINATDIQTDGDGAFVSIMTTVSLIMFILMGSIAMTNMPWALLGELLPTKARALGNSIITAYSSVLLFVVLKSIPLLLDFISLSTLFFTFGCMSALSAVYMCFNLPETFSKSLQEIERYFIKENIPSKTDTENGLLKKIIKS